MRCQDCYHRDHGTPVSGRLAVCLNCERCNENANRAAIQRAADDSPEYQRFYRALHG